MTFSSLDRFVSHYISNKDLILFFLLKVHFSVLIVISCCFADKIHVNFSFVAPLNACQDCQYPASSADLERSLCILSPAN